MQSLQICTVWLKKAPFSTGITQMPWEANQGQFLLFLCKNYAFNVKNNFLNNFNIMV